MKYNEISEQYILGVCLNDGYSLSEILTDRITENEFYNSRNKHIFIAII